MPCEGDHRYGIFSEDGMLDFKRNTILATQPTALHCTPLPAVSQAPENSTKVKHAWGPLQSRALEDWHATFSNFLLQRPTMWTSKTRATERSSKSLWHKNKEHASCPNPVGWSTARTTRALSPHWLLCLSLPRKLATLCVFAHTSTLSLPPSGPTTLTDDSLSRFLVDKFELITGQAKHYRTGKCCQ